MVFHLLLVYQEGQQYRLILNCASLILISALPVHPDIKENQDVADTSVDTILVRRSWQRGGRQAT